VGRSSVLGGGEVPSGWPEKTALLYNILGFLFFIFYFIMLYFSIKQ